MPDWCSWLGRSCCCQRHFRSTYIYLYSPNVSGSSSSSPSSLFQCLVCILFGLCLAFVVILTTVVIYRMNSNDYILSPNANADQRAYSIAKKRQLPDFVNINIDPCEYFYEFVCDKWTRRKKTERYDKGEEYEQKWTRIRHEIHDKLMVNISSTPPRSSESDSSSSVHHLYQLCETQSPSLLLDELERYFARFIQQEPYRSCLTLFNQTNYTNLRLSPIILQHNPFFKILYSSSDNNNQPFSSINQLNRRPLPSPIVIFPNLTILNQTALKHLIKFDNDYTKIIREANSIIKVYDQEYNQDSLIMKRILSFSDYHICLSSLNTTNGLQNLIQLLNHFLQYHLGQFNTNLFDKQIRILDKITDNHTLVEHLKRIRLEFKIIEEVVPVENNSNNSNSSCIINLLDKLLDKRVKLNELPLSITLFSPNETSEYFISNDWPFLIMLYDRLLKKTSIDTLINFVFFDYYRHLIYPYYQPHVHDLIDIATNHTREYFGYTYETNYPNLSCHVNSCFDILNCYHPSSLNQLMNDQNPGEEGSLDCRNVANKTVSGRDYKKTINDLFRSNKKHHSNLIDQFRLLTEQSDHLFAKEKKLILNEINQIKILIGHYSSSFNSSPILNSSSYLEYVQVLSALPYDQEEHSYNIEPIYYPINHILYIPYGFLHLSNNSISYSVIKLLLKILSKTIQSNPFDIECFIKSSDDFNTTIIDSNDEHIIYLLYRSKFLYEENIIFDEYLWPFMSANSLMKRFLINYTANNYCHSSNGYHLFLNNTYLIDDVHLVFHCQQASSIKQSKCTVI